MTTISPLISTNRYVDFHLCRTKIICDPIYLTLNTVVIATIYDELLQPR